MAHDERIANRVRRLLSKRRRVVEKRLMGQLAFMVNGSMCCTVGPEGILVRVSPDERERALSLPHVTPMKLGHRTMSGFVRVGDAAIGTDAALARWIEQGIEAGAVRKKRKTAEPAKRSRAKRAGTSAKAARRLTR